MFGRSRAAHPKPDTAEGMTSSELPLLINRDFALLWAGSALSVLGDWVFQTTLVIWIAADLARGKSWAPLAVTGLLAASSVAILLVGPFAGALVDRWNKRRCLIWTNALSALLIVLMLPVVIDLPLLGGHHLPLLWRLGAVFLAVFLVNACAQFAGPASLVLLGDIVPGPEQPRATSLKQASRSIAMLLGPPLATPLLIAFGPAWALAIDAASFVAPVLTVMAIRAREALPDPAANPPDRLLRGIAVGLRHFAGSRVLTTLAVSLVVTMLGAGALNALDVFFVTKNLGAPTSDYGLLGGAQGAGMIIGAILAGLLAQRIGLSRMVWGALLSLGVLLIVYSRMESLTAGLAVTFVLGLVEPALNVVVGPIMLAVTPREILGRISATMNPLVNGAMIIGMLLGGFLYSTLLHDFHAALFGVRFGPLDTIFLGGGSLILVAALYAWRNLRAVLIEAPVQSEPGPVSGSDLAASSSAALGAGSSSGRRG